MSGRNPWTPEEDQILIAAWRKSPDYGKVIRLLPNHASVATIKQRLSRLRQRGVELPFRPQPKYDKAARRARQAEAARVWRAQRDAERAARSAWHDVRFADDPRAQHDGGIVKLPVPISAAVSAIGSTAALAVR